LHGRERLLEEVGGLVWGSDARLITLTGLAGVGKTRVVDAVIEPTSEHLDRARASAMWIDAYGFESGELLPAIAELVGAPAGVEHDAHEIGVRLDSVRRVVVIDGADTASDAPDVIGRLLASTDSTQFVVTRRMPLRLTHERVVRVEPLCSASGTSEDSMLASLPSVRIFLDIATELGSDVSGDPSALEAIAAIVRRLGGIPAAIELAASRVGVFSPSTMLDLLARASVSDVLSGSDDGSALFLAISWTESMLEPAQRQLLADMTVFAGPVPVDAIAAVVGRNFGDVIDDVSDLVDIHLLVVDHSRSMSAFALHPLVRGHAEAIGSGARTRTIRQAHVRWALDMVAPVDRAGAVEASVALVERDLVAALRSCLAADDAEGAASIAVTLGPLWLRRGIRARDSELMAEVVSALDTTSSDAGLRALVIGWSALFRAERAVVTGDTADIIRDRDTAVTLAERTDERTRLAVWALAVQTARIFDDRTVAIRLCEEGRMLAHGAGDLYNRAQFETWSAMLAHQTGRIDDAATMGEAALGTARHLGDSSLIIKAAGLLLTLPAEAEMSVALPTASELVQLACELDDRRSLLWLQPTATSEALREGDHLAAARLIEEHMTATQAVGAWAFGAVSLMLLAQLAVARGDDDRAGWLHGIVAGHFELLLPSLPARAIVDYERSIAQLSDRLGEARLEQVAASGALLSIEDAHADAVGYARSIVDATPSMTEGTATTAESLLTAREIEVLDRLVDGDRNKDVALYLGITPKTVMHHTSSIYRKLGVRGRSEAVAWALRGPTPAGH
jgi:DNA-binding CsgD family transcriptional regulator/predicted ATPase